MRACASSFSADSRVVQGRVGLRTGKKEEASRVERIRWRNMCALYMKGRERREKGVGSESKRRVGIERRKGGGNEKGEAVDWMVRIY